MEQSFAVVRHVVPVTPFVFLLAAVVLVRLPKMVALATGVVTTYWTWCLCMYRDVEANRGVLESFLQITLGGVRLPWLTTVERMGLAYPAYLPRFVPALLILTAAGGLIALIWRRSTPDKVDGLAGIR